MRLLTTLVGIGISTLLAGDALAVYGVTTNVFVSNNQDPPVGIVQRIRNGTRTLSDSTSFADSSTGRDFHSQVTSSLVDGTVRARVNGKGGPGGGSSNGLLIAQGILIDEFTFPGTYSNQSVPFTVSLDGIWTVSGAPLDTALAQAQMKVFAADTLPNDDTLFNVASNASTPTLYNQTISGNATSAYPITGTGSVLLNGVNPSVQFYFNSQVIASSTNIASVFDGDFTHTSTISFAFAPNMVVQSSSGTFPGTSAVPEPFVIMPLLAAGTFLMRRR